MILSPVVFALFAAIQVKLEEIVAPKGMFTVLPLQIVALFELVIVGAGFTVTAIDCVAPMQPPAEDVGFTE